MTLVLNLCPQFRPHTYWSPPFLFYIGTEITISIQTPARSLRIQPFSAHALLLACTGSRCSRDEQGPRWASTLVQGGSSAALHPSSSNTTAEAMLMVRKRCNTAALQWSSSAHSRVVGNRSWNNCYSFCTNSKEMLSSLTGETEKHFNTAPQNKSIPEKMPLFNALWEELLVPSMGSEGLLGSTLSEHLISFHFPLILTGKTGI